MYLEQKPDKWNDATAHKPCDYCDEIVANADKIHPKGETVFCIRCYCVYLTLKYRPDAAVSILYSLFPEDLRGAVVQFNHGNDRDPYSLQELVWWTHQKLLEERANSKHHDQRAAHERRRTAGEANPELENES